MIGYWTANNSEPAYDDHYHIRIWTQKTRLILSSLGRLVCGWFGRTVKLPFDTQSSFCRSIPHTPAIDGYLNASATLPTSVAQMPLQWEWHVASVLYFVIVPVAQFILAMILADTFQYFTHRAFHVNKWLYSKSKFRSTSL